MIFNDDRTPEQKKTHYVLIAATDSFMSGWGKAKNGTSYCAWACKPQDADKVWRWVNNRREMKRVRRVAETWKPRGEGHTQIYVVDDNHPAIK
jgi:hypothetical protein